EKRTPAEREMQKLQGAWIVELNSMDGKSTRPADKREFTFKGDTIIIRGPQESIVSFKIDLSRNPPVLELTSRKGDVGFVRQLALYEVNGDTLRLCVAHGSDGTLPSRFDDAGHLLMTLKRKTGH